MKHISFSKALCITTIRKQSICKICHRRFTVQKTIQQNHSSDAQGMSASSMGSDKPRSPASVLNFQMWNQIQAGKYQDAERLFAEAITTKQPVNETTFNNMIVCMLRQKKIPQLDTLRQEMWNRHLRVYPKTMSLVLKHFSREGDIQNTLSWFRQLKKNRMPIDAFHVNSLLHAYANAGRISDMLQTFLDWLEKMPLDAGVFNTVLSHLANENHLAGIQTILQLAQKHNIKIDRMAFFKAFIAVKSLDQYDALKELYNMMPLMDIQPDLDTFLALMSAGKSNHEEVKKHWQEMKKHNIKPNITAWNMLIDSYQKQGDFNGCLEVWNELLRTTTQPVTITLNIMINTYAKMGDAAKVTETFASFSKWNLPHSVTTYIAMINFYSKRGDTQKAVEMLDKMEAEGLRPTNHRSFVVLQRLRKNLKSPTLTTEMPKLIEPMEGGLLEEEADKKKEESEWGLVLTDAGELRETKQ